MLAELLFGGRESRSMENPSEQLVAPAVPGLAPTPENALTVSAFVAGVTCLANALKIMPIKAHQRDGESRRALDDHPVTRVLHRAPNPELSAGRFKWWMVACAVAHGNGYAEIVRNGRGELQELWPIHPSRVEVRRDRSGLYYAVRNDGRAPTILRSHQVFHLRGFALPDLDVGRSCADTGTHYVSLELNQTRHASAMYKGGGIPAGILRVNKALDDANIELVRKSWSRKFGGPESVGEVAVLDANFGEFTAIGFSPKLTNLIESRRFTISDFARILNVPLTRLRDLQKATWGNYEQESISFWQESVLPWALDFEQEADLKLFLRRERDAGLYVKTSFAALARADLSARTAHYATMLLNGVYSVNEVRAYEDLDPIGPEGDEHRVPLNTTPAGGRNPPNAPPSPTDNGEDRALRLAAVHSLVRDTAGRVITRELDRVARALKKEVRALDVLDDAAARRALAPIGASVILLAGEDLAVDAALEVRRQVIAAAAPEDIETLRDTLPEAFADALLERLA